MAEYNENMLINVELPFINSKKIYPSQPIGISFYNNFFGLNHNFDKFNLQYRGFTSDYSKFTF